MEQETGAILYEKNIHATYYPASITKILTALVALEEQQPGRGRDLFQRRGLSE